MKEWTGFSWLRIRTSGKLLWAWFCRWIQTLFLDCFFLKMLPNFGIGVFTKLRWVTSEKSPEAIKVYVCTCWRQTDVTGPNFQHPIHKSLSLNPMLQEMNPFVTLHIFIAIFSHVYVLSHACYMPCPHPWLNLKKSENRETSSLWTFLRPFVAFFPSHSKTLCILFHDERVPRSYKNNRRNYCL